MTLGPQCYIFPHPQATLTIASLESIDYIPHKKKNVATVEFEFETVSTSIVDYLGAKGCVKRMSSSNIHYVGLTVINIYEKRMKILTMYLPFSNETD